eukprot:gene12179-10498_t
MACAVKIESFDTMKRILGPVPETAADSDEPDVVVPARSTPVESERVLALVEYYEKK